MGEAVMKPEEAREQVRLRLKSMAEHPGGSMEDLTESIMALFYLLSPDQDLGRALIPAALESEPLAVGYCQACGRKLRLGERHGSRVERTDA